LWICTQQVNIHLHSVMYKLLQQLSQLTVQFYPLHCGIPAQLSGHLLHGEYMPDLGLSSPMTPVFLLTQLNEPLKDKTIYLWTPQFRIRVTKNNIGKKG